MESIQLSPANSTKDMVGGVIAAAVGVVLAGAGAVFLTGLGMFAAVVWFH